MTAPGAQASSIAWISLSETWPREGMNSSRQCRFAQLIVGGGGLPDFDDVHAELGVRWSLRQPLGVELTCLHLLHSLIPLAQCGSIRLIEELLDGSAEVPEAFGVGSDIEEDGPKGRAELGQ